MLRNDHLMYGLITLVLLHVTTSVGTCTKPIWNKITLTDSVLKVSPNNEAISLNGIWQVRNNNDTVTLSSDVPGDVHSGKTYHKTC